jgi:hypothetical protein
MVSTIFQLPPLPFAFHNMVDLHGEENGGLKIKDKNFLNFK